MIKTKRIEFTEISDARFKDNAALTQAMKLHTIGCDLNSIATVAREDLKTARDLGKNEWEENISTSLILKWMEEIQAKVQKALRESLDKQTK